MRSSARPACFSSSSRPGSRRSSRPGARSATANMPRPSSRRRPAAMSCSDPDLRHEIMRLRKDPTANAVMAGVFTQNNAARASQSDRPCAERGRTLHCAFLRARRRGEAHQHANVSPQTTAAAMFPRAAHANRPIFYDKQGNARSVAGVYDEVVRRYQVARLTRAGRRGREPYAPTGSRRARRCHARGPRPGECDTAGAAQVLRREPPQQARAARRSIRCSRLRSPRRRIAHDRAALASPSGLRNSDSAAAAPAERAHAARPVPGSAAERPRAVRGECVTRAPDPALFPRKRAAINNSASSPAFMVNALLSLAG